MRIITRAEWGAIAPSKRPVRVAPTWRREFVVHHSGAFVGQTVRAIQHWCMAGRGFADIDYNFLVRGSTGEIYEGRGWDVIGAHTVGHNTAGIGVCVIGSDELSPAAMESVRWLYQQANARCARTLTVRGHRDLTNTTCPGDRIEVWLRAGMPLATGRSEVDVISPTDMETLAALTAEKVWAHTYGSKATESRWPGRGRKRMDIWGVTAAMRAHDAARSAAAAPTAAQIVAAVVPTLNTTDLAGLLRTGMTDEARAALVAALSD